MPAPSFKRVYSKDVPELNEAQDNIFEIVQFISAKAILDGIILQDVSLSTAGSQIPHKLDRKPIGFIVIKNNAGSIVFESAEATDTFLNLDCSANCVVSLWVF